MTSVDDESNTIYNIINGNNVAELENYLFQNNIHPEDRRTTNDNDLLIYAIENNASNDIIACLLHHYPTLNYTFYAGNYRYKNPLFSAIGEGHLRVARLLMENNADINYDLVISQDQQKQSILYNLANLASINPITLRIILRSGLRLDKITPDLILLFIQICYKNRYLHVIFRHYIFDNEFILKLLQYYKHATVLSNEQLSAIITNEKNKIKITDKMYVHAMKKWYEKIDVIELLLSYDCRDAVHLFGLIQKYKLLEKGIWCNHLNLVKKVLYYYDTNVMNQLDVDHIINEAMSYNYTPIIQCLIDHLYTPSNNPFEKFLLPASKNNNFEIIEYIFNKLFIIDAESENDTTISTEIISTDTCDRSYLSLLLNLCIKTRNRSILNYLMENNTFSINVNQCDKNDEYPIILAYYNMLVDFQKDNSVSKEIFKCLLEYGAMGTIKNKEGHSIYSLAIRDKSYTAINYLLRYSHNFSTIEDTFHSVNPLVHAIFQDDINTVEKLINNDNEHYEVIMVDGITTTPIILSYFLNQQNIFRFLLKNLNIHEIDQFGNTIFYYAILKEDIDTINFLISFGIDVNFNENSNGRGNMPLHIAIKIGCKEVFQILLKSKKVFVDEPDENGDTPLMLVIKSSLFSDENKRDMVHQLLKKGLNINKCNRENKRTALAYAIQQKSIFLIKLLIKHGAKINYVADNTYQSLLVFALHVGDLDTLIYLIKYTPEDQLLDSFIEELIEQYEKGQIPEIFEYLIKYNPNNISKKIIRIVIDQNKYDLLKFITEPRFNVNINLKDKEGNIPLVYAVKNRNKAIIQYLINHGANISNINHKGYSVNDINNIYNFNYYENTYYEIKSLLNPIT